MNEPLCVLAVSAVGLTVFLFFSYGEIIVAVTCSPSRFRVTNAGHAISHVRNRKEGTRIERFLRVSSLFADAQEDTSLRRIDFYGRSAPLSNGRRVNKRRVCLTGALEISQREKARASRGSGRRVVCVYAAPIDDFPRRRFSPNNARTRRL